MRLENHQYCPRAELLHKAYDRYRGKCAYAERTKEGEEEGRGESFLLVEERFGRNAKVKKERNELNNDRVGKLVFGIGRKCCSCSSRSRKEVSFSNWDFRGRKDRTDFGRERRGAENDS